MRAHRGGAGRRLSFGAHTAREKESAGDTLPHVVRSTGRLTRRCCCTPADQQPVSGRRSERKRAVVVYWQFG